MTLSWTKEDVVANILSRLNLSEPRKLWSSLQIKTAALRLKDVLFAARQDNLPVIEGNTRMLLALIELSNRGQASSYHLIKCIEAHHEAFQAAMFTLARTQTLFNKELAKTKAS